MHIAHLIRENQLALMWHPSCFFSFSRIFTRMILIPFQKREGKQSTSERLEGKQKFEAFLRAAPKSVGVFTRLHEAYEEMTKSRLFKTVEQEIQSLNLDVQSQRQI